MGEYRIKGSGDIREVYDGPVLVGRIKRKSRRVASWLLTPTRATCRTRTEVWWIAMWPDGSAVLRADGSRACGDRMKDWRKPANWREWSEVPRR